MTPIVSSAKRIGLLCAWVFISGACRQRVELEREPSPLGAAHPGSPAAAPSERQRLFLSELQLHPTPSHERTSFVQAEVKSARFSAAAAMHAWASRDTGLADNAFGFLQNVEDLGIVPALEQPLPSDPLSAYQSLSLIGDAETELRRKVLLHVDALLGDTRELASEAGQAGSPHRVCDEAYLALRRLVAFPGPEFKQPVVAKSFFASSPAARSALIERARREPTWRRILDPNADIEDSPTKSSPHARAHSQLTPMQ